MIRSVLAGVACAALAGGGAAQAADLFYSTFEDVPGAPTAGNYSTVASADGWTSTTHGIELQNNVAGAPAADGGAIFVELDTDQNSSMSRTIDTAGTYTLSWEYSPRPNNPAGSNGIEAFIDGTPIAPPGLVTSSGGSSTSWSTFSGTFTAQAGSVLTFRAEGTSDSLGGYIDNIRAVSAAPEPGVWALMFGGVALMGAALRYRRREGGSALSA